MIEKKLRQLCEKFNSSKTIHKDQIDQIQVWSELMLAKQELERFHRSKEVSETDDN
tara:strand:- start:5878 stop:6045 length:168 start_codon:yes stop_codon:yes gene_type:complete